MTDPERLLDTDGGGLSAALLRAGRVAGRSCRNSGDIFAVDKMFYFFPSAI